MSGMSVYIKLCLGSLKVWYVRVSLFIRIYVRVCYGMIRVQGLGFRVYQEMLIMTLYVNILEGLSIHGISEFLF